jgi:polyhydroxyalkanoate synthase
MQAGVAPGHESSIGGLDAFRRAPFQFMDVVRRAHGDMLGALGFGPTECAYRVRSAGPHWRLRDYGGDDGSPHLLVIAAPIKRPYIWDLSPSASAIRLCLQRRFHVHLLEWLPPSDRDGDRGIHDCVRAISECVATISGQDGDAKPFILGHSLGGTLGAIFATLAPETIRGLVLLAAPLSFKPGSGEFRDALVSIVPSGLFGPDAVPGSLLTQVSVMAWPRSFIWSRLADAVFSSGDYHALDVQTRVERWTLDEVPLPGRLLTQIVEWLYREDRLSRGALPVGDGMAGPARLAVPTLAVVNTADEIAPLASMEDFLDAMPTPDVGVIEYPGEAGVSLQHVGVLVGRQAHGRVWPKIIDWLSAHR